MAAPNRQEHLATFLFQKFFKHYRVEPAELRIVLANQDAAVILELADRGVRADLNTLRDLAALAEDNAVMAYPRSAALEDCLKCIRDLRAKLAAAPAA